ncbi:hypothetical protein BaRGS_00011548 [Batillaria attramentaria]|uniref:Uncharacterized protein n=1 Tax=Batillaria attramentaria TaxID=370345 RepID=A0ABD0LCR5_9CAEN
MSPGEAEASDTVIPEKPIPAMGIGLKGQVCQTTAASNGQQLHVWWGTTEVAGAKMRGRGGNCLRGDNSAWQQTTSPTCHR